MIFSVHQACADGRRKGGTSTSPRSARSLRRLLPPTRAICAGLSPTLIIHVEIGKLRDVNLSREVKGPLTRRRRTQDFTVDEDPPTLTLALLGFFCLIKELVSLGQDGYHHSANLHVSHYWQTRRPALRTTVRITANAGKPLILPNETPQKRHCRLGPPRARPLFAALVDCSRSWPCA